MPLFQKTVSTVCYHCGEPCREGSVSFENYQFCCSGCKTVYEIIENNGLCQYYDLENSPGINLTGISNSKTWQFLDDLKITRQLSDFMSDNLTVVSFHIPTMHCSSCIYLLENLSRLAKGVLSSDVNFLKKEITIKFDPREISLRRVVETLSSIGYSPEISLNGFENRKTSKATKHVVYQIAIAGFCFGNIMILSLPEYFDVKSLLTENFIHLFRYLNLFLIMPVLFFSASDYFKSSWNALRHKHSNMDVAITMGILGLSIQSFYDVLAGIGGGYFDSLSGLIFFLLIGKFIQQRTFQALSFDRDYKSYFPLAITRVKGEESKSINVNDLMLEDEILVHNKELIPADSILEKGEAFIDYSFVTGESRSVLCCEGDMIYAGGRNQGSILRLRVIKTVSQSYLTRLWNNKAFNKAEETGVSKWATQLSNYFTVTVIALALITGIYWKIHNPALVMQTVTAVLIVACPCVLALSIPFTFGQIMSILGKKGMYLKNSQSIEKLAAVDTIVFDKTGTLTVSDNIDNTFNESLSNEERQWIAATASQSLHPISRMIKGDINGSENYPITNWEETIGEGIRATIKGNEIKIGKRDFVSGDIPEEFDNEQGSLGKTYISVNGIIKTGFAPIQKLRGDIKDIAGKLKGRFQLYILSGDNDSQRKTLSKYFPYENLYFRQSPQDKLVFIESLKESGKNVMMIGDGLNDAGALKTSDFGITVTNDIHSFTPSSDAIMDINQMGLLPNFASLARDTKKIVTGALVFSIMYNCIGLSFAVRGHLLPWVAAILMPVSSITVVLYTKLASMAAARKNKLS